MSYADVASIAVILLGLVVLVVGVLVLRAPMVGIAVMLELWTGAGLLRLSAAGTWSAITIAAFVVMMRKVVVSQLATASRDASG